MQIQLLRHATFLLNIRNIKMLVDPMLSPAEAMDPVQNAAVQKRIPLVGLPVSEEELQKILTDLTAVLVTHVHRDHWDSRATDLVPKHLPLFCQSEDETFFRKKGFQDLHPLRNDEDWRGLTISRTGGQHGTGEIGKKMGPVSGFILKMQGEPMIYIAGDTVWCPEVKEALRTHQLDLVVLYAGQATFLSGGPITMSAEDVITVCREIPKAKVIAIHMEAINHCLLTRAELEKKLEIAGVLPRVQVPKDGEVMIYEASTG